MEADAGAEKAGKENLIERPLGRVKKHAAPQLPLAARKTVVDEFMLKEYENIAAAHFDSQTGLRQQFRFYLILAAVPLTILGFALKDQPEKIDQFSLLNLPLFIDYVFFAVGLLGLAMLLAMIHTAHDATLYARTVNGLRAFFHSRGMERGLDIAPYLLMPLETDKPKYFRLRSFFWLVTFMVLVNTAYIAVPAVSLWGHEILIPVCAFVVQMVMYPVLSWARERRKTVA